MSGFDIFEEIKKQTAMFNEPRHLPQPLPVEPRDEFDIYDDVAMREIFGAGLARPCQDLLITLAQAGNLAPERFKEIALRELKALRDAAKEEWRAL